MRSGAAVRSAEELLPASQSVETNIDAPGIPQYGQEWTAREKHSWTNHHWLGKNSQSRLPAFEGGRRIRVLRDHRQGLWLTSTPA